MIDRTIHYNTVQRRDNVAQEINKEKESLH